MSGAFGIMDPPTALQTVDEIVKPTMPSVKVDPSGMATPKQDPGRSTAQATSSPAKISTAGSLQPILTMTRDHKTQSSTISEIQTRPEGQPEAVFTLGGDAYTIHSDELIVGDGTIVDLSRQTTVTIDGHTINIENGKLHIDSSVIAISQPGSASSTNAVDPIGTSNDMARTSLPVIVSAPSSSRMDSTTSTLSPPSSAEPSISIRPVVSSETPKRLLRIYQIVIAGSIVLAIKL